METSPQQPKHIAKKTLGPDQFKKNKMAAKAIALDFEAGVEWLESVSKTEISGGDVIVPLNERKEGGISSIEKVDINTIETD